MSGPHLFTIFLNGYVWMVKIFCLSMLILVLFRPCGKNGITRGYSKNDGMVGEELYV